MKTARMMSVVMLVLAALLLWGTAAQADNLVAYWTFDSLSGSNVLDSSGNNLTATNLGGVTFAAGKLGNGGVFNGTSTSYLNGGNSTAYNAATGETQPRTVTVWLNTTTTNNTTGMFLLNKPPGQNGINHFGTFIYGTNKLYWAPQGGSSYWVASTTSVTDGAWHLGVMTYDYTGGTYYRKLYLDGGSTPQGSTTVAAPCDGDNTGTVYIGANTAATYTFTGSIDDLAIWDYAVNAAEARAVYKVATSSYAYGAGNAQSLFKVHHQASGSVTIGQTIWSYATGLDAIKGSAVVGDLFTYDGHDYLYLANGGPEAGTGLMVYEPAGDLHVIDFDDNTFGSGDSRSLNGIYDTGEQILSGREFSVTGSGGPYYRTTVDGEFTLSELAVGDYGISETLPLNWTSTTGGSPRIATIVDASTTTMYFGSYYNLPATVPEPAALGLIGLALLAIRRRSTLK